MLLLLLLLQIRAVHGGPDSSPSEVNTFDADPEDEDLIFGLDDMPPPGVQASRAPAAQSAAAPRPRQPATPPQMAQQVQAAPELPNAPKSSTPLEVTPEPRLPAPLQAAAHGTTTGEVLEVRAPFS